MARHTIGEYKSGYFCRGINSNLTIITCEDRIVIPLTLKRYI